ncbi:hypothetical protein, partial [Bacillus thuringiensis]|uniref:hypothetical protein n=1 Tax=Bacillus thuringiensis TaxID=1428 RepID=UPI001CA4718F
CVFRHFSQYKYNTVFPKQPAHFLPKSGHDSATYFSNQYPNLLFATVLPKSVVFGNCLLPLFLL